MNSFPINNCLVGSPVLIDQISCPSSKDYSNSVECSDCLFYRNLNNTSNIPESKKKFLRDMIFSTGDFDEK